MTDSPLNYVVRPVRLDDLDRLVELAELTSFGLTTLPKDRRLLQKRVRASQRAFEVLEEGEPGGETYLFVIEESSSHLALGTCGVVSKVGGFEPFYTYRIDTSVHDSRMLNVRKEIKVLHLDEDHDGPSEVGSLFLHPDARRGGQGRLLSLSRFLFMAEFPHLFEKEVIAEMRGVIDDQGRTPFWDALGKHFFDLEFPKADYLSVINKEFIGDLMPRYPIYIPLLPAEAQGVIGEVHELTRPARRMLELEGFRFRNRVDIFEAGPVLHCAREEIRAVRESRSAEVVSLGAPEEEPEMLIASRSNGFRACRGRVREVAGGVEISAAVAERLETGPGGTVRYVEMRPPAN